MTEKVYLVLHDIKRAGNGPVLNQQLGYTVGRFAVLGTTNNSGHAWQHLKTSLATNND